MTPKYSLSNKHRRLFKWDLWLQDLQEVRSCVTDWGAASPLTSHWSWQLCCSDGEVSTGWASCAFRRLLFALGCGLSFSLWRQINLCPWSVNYCPPLSESQTASILTPCQRLPHSVPHFYSLHFFLVCNFLFLCSCSLTFLHILVKSSCRFKIQPRTLNTFRFPTPESPEVENFYCWVLTVAWTN